MEVAAESTGDGSLSIEPSSLGVPSRSLFSSLTGDPLSLEPLLSERFLLLAEKRGRVGVVSERRGRKGEGKENADGEGGVLGQSCGRSEASYILLTSCDKGDAFVIALHMYSVLPKRDMTNERRRTKWMQPVRESWGCGQG